MSKRKQKSMSYFIILLILFFAVLKLSNQTNLVAKIKDVENKIDSNSEFSACFEDIAIVDDLAFVVTRREYDFESRSKIFDISNMSNIRVIHGYHFVSEMEGDQIEIRDHLAYIFNTDLYTTSLKVINITEYYWPTQESSLLIEPGFYWTIDPTHLIIEDDYAYALTNWANRSRVVTNNTFNIIDIQNKSNIFSISQSSYAGYIADMAKKDDLIYLLRSVYGVFVTASSSVIYYGKNQLEIVNVTIKNNPTRTYSLELNYRPKSIGIVNDTLIIGYYNDGFEIFRMIDEITFESIYHYTEKINLNVLTVENNLLYIAVREGIMIFDIRNKENAILLGEEYPRFKGYGYYKEIMIWDGYVFGLRYDRYGDIPMIIYDCRDPTKPYEIYPLEIDNYERKVWLFKVITGGVIAPVIILSLGSLVLTKFVKNKKSKRKSRGENGN